MANTNVVNFNDAVLQRQRSNSASNTSMGVAANDDKIKEIAIVGNKQLIGQESMTKTLLVIKKTLQNISKTLETNLAITLKGASPNVGSAIAAGTEETENQEESDKRKKDSSDLQEKLLQNIVSGITGLAKITNDKLGKLGELYKEGANSGSDQSMFGRMKGGLGNITKSGKGFFSGIGDRLSAAKDAFKSGREAGGISRGLGRAFSSLRGPTGGTTVPGFNRAPGSFGTGNWNTGPVRGPAMASRVAGTAVEAGTAAEAGGGLLAGAGRMLATPLAGAAALGLAGFGMYNDITGNIDKSNDIESSRASGALTDDQANVLQGESLGDTAGTTAGGLIGGIAGSALGPLGTAAGAWLGSKAGGWIGGKAGKYGVKAYQGIKSMLGFGDTEEEKAAKLTPEQKNMQDFASGKIDADTYNQNMKNQVEGTQPETAPIAKQTVSGNDLMVPPVDNTPVTTAASLAPGEEFVPSSNIVAVPTQTPSEAKGTGVWDSMKSMGTSALGGIKSGANWVGDKASELGTGISDWFGGTRIGQDLAKRNVGVGYNGIGVAGGEELVGSKENLETTDSSTGESSRKFNTGVTVEKSALGSSWLGRLIAGKGTQTESFVADSSKESVDKEGKVSSEYASSLGQRKSGGWFGKDEYTLTDPTTGEPVTVDKSTYMKAKSIAEKGGDAGEIGGLIKKDQEAKNAAMAPAGNTAMGDYGGDYDNSSIVDDGTPTVRPKAAGASKSMRVGKYQGDDPNAPNYDSDLAQSKEDFAPLAERGGSRGSDLYDASSQTADAKDAASSKGTGGTAVINAPTNVNNTTQNATITKSPAKNPEPSLSRYLGTKYGAF